MAAKVVIGLFQSEGIAEDARNRLHTESVPADEIHLRVLSKIGPMPATMGPEMDASFLNSVMLGNFRDSFSSYIRNGETMVCVQALTDERLELAVDTLKQYTPLAVSVASQPEAGGRVTIDPR